MQQQQHRDRQLQLIHALHPGYDARQAEESLENLRTFFDLAWAIFLRLEREGLLDKLDLTASSPDPTMKVESPRTHNL